MFIINLFVSGVTCELYICAIMMIIISANFFMVKAGLQFSVPKEFWLGELAPSSFRQIAKVSSNTSVVVRIDPAAAA